MAIATTQASACAGCEQLKGSSKFDQGPHEYLVLRRTGPVCVYQCLVCHTNLSCDSQTGTLKWSELASSPERMENLPQAGRPAAAGLDPRRPLTPG
jgi:hypothetical protein